MTNPIDRRVKTFATSYTVLIIVAAIAGAVAVPIVQSAGTDTDQQNHIAVVTLDSLLITGGSAGEVAETLRDIRENDSIDAVVLRVASPGGSIAGSEAQYRAVKQLAQEKPVIASVRGVAASGGYYTILPADRIYVQPGSVIGSVGVLSTTPQNKEPPGQWASAPDKGTAGPADAARARASTWKRSFVSTVMDERGDELELSRTEVARAKVYAGNRAVELGVADRIGGLETAIAAAATEAELDSYELAYYDPPGLSLSSLFGGAENVPEYPVPASCLVSHDAVALDPGLAPEVEVTKNATC